MADGAVPVPVHDIMSATGNMMPAPETCPECKEEDALVACGPGVERIADEVAALFPEARTAIVTSDTIWSPAKAAEFVARMEAPHDDPGSSDSTASDNSR